MAHVEYETQGWFSRIGDSIKGIFGGIAIFLLAVPLIFWNECRAVDRAEDLAFGKGSVVQADAAKVDAGNEGKLVHVVGDVKVEGKPTDKAFKITVDGLALERTVEMYQWKEKVKKEKEKKTGGKEVTKKTYTYEKVWSATELKSGEYKEKDKINPGPLPYKSETAYASGATLGAYKLTDSTMSGLGTSKPYEVDKKVLAALSAGDQKIAQINNGEIYIGKSPSKPAVGDVRIKFQVRVPGKATVVAGQYGSELKAFTHKKLNDPLVLTSNGSKTPDELFESAESANNMMTWILRLVSYIMMFAGLAAVFRPLSVIADVIPFIGSIVGTATSLVAFLLATPMWLFCVAAAWIVARPLIGILLMVGALMLIGGLIAAAMAFKKKAAA